MRYDSAIQGHQEWRQRNLTVVGAGQSLCIIVYVPAQVWKKSKASRALADAVVTSVTLQMTGALLAAAPLPRRQIWCVGGGKGGIGKSLLTAALGWQLARLGKRVVLVDADLGGANLHTCLGLAGPALHAGRLHPRRVERIEDVVLETGFPRLRLISGASDFLGAANIKYPQKVRVLNRIRALDVDVVLMDLGAGTSFNIIDFFLISDLGMLAVVPEPTSIENGYRFIKSALYRRLRSGGADARRVREIVDAAMDPKNRPRHPHAARPAGGRGAGGARRGRRRSSARSRPSTRASWSTRSAAPADMADRPPARDGLRPPPRHPRQLTPAACTSTTRSGSRCASRGCSWRTPRLPRRPRTCAGWRAACRAARARWRPW